MFLQLMSRLLGKAIAINTTEIVNEIIRNWSHRVYFFTIDLKSWILYLLTVLGTHSRGIKVERWVPKRAACLTFGAWALQMTKHGSSEWILSLLLRVI